jgi:hypothetical protein
MNVGDGIYVYSGPEYIPPATTTPIITTIPSISNITIVTPPICKICKFYNQCTTFNRGILTLEDCKKGLGIEEKSVKIKVKKKPR